MVNILSVPDIGKESQKYMVFALAMIWSAVIGAIVSAGFIFLPDLWPRWLLYIGISIFIAALNITISHIGYTHLASWLLIIMLWFYVTIPCLTAGGIMSPGILMQVPLMLTAAILLGWKPGMVIVFVTMVADFGMAYLEVIGLLPEPTVVHNPLTRWVSAIIPFGAIIILQYYATKQLRSSLNALKEEIFKREEAEKVKDLTVYQLGERVKELKTLFEVSRILQNESAQIRKTYHEIIDVLPQGWQYPEVTAVQLKIGGTDYASPNFHTTESVLMAETKTIRGTVVNLTVAYLESRPGRDEGPFLKEERNLLNTLVEMIKTDLERREQREIQHAMIENMSDGLLLLNADWKVIFQSPSVKQITGYTLAERNSKDAYELIHPEDVELLQRTIQEALQNPNKQIKHHLRLIHKTGKVVWIDGSLVNLLDSPDIGAILVNYTDVTERKAAEEKIVESEKLLRKITSQVPSTTYMFELEENGHTHVLFMNRGTDPFSQSSDHNENTGNSRMLHDALYDEDKAKFFEAMKRAYQTKSVISVQYRMVANEHVRWCWMQAVPEKDKNGKMVWYGATSDITPLVDYVASIEQFLWDFGHVIRRPLSSMKGMTRLVIDNNFSAQELKEISIRLHKISEEMDAFISELNRIYDQKREKAKFEIDVSSLIDKRSSLFN